MDQPDTWRIRDAAVAGLAVIQDKKELSGDRLEYIKNLLQNILNIAEDNIIK